ncbi:MAG: hypothetical protein ACUZ8N_10835 [Candidatus Scalindua sp.]
MKCKCGHEEEEHPEERCERTGEGLTDGDCIIKDCDCKQFIPSEIDNLAISYGKEKTYLDKGKKIGCGKERPVRKTLCQLFEGHKGSCQAVIYWEDESTLCKNNSSESRSETPIKKQNQDKKPEETIGNNKETSGSDIPLIEKRTGDFQ